MVDRVFIEGDNSEVQAPTLREAFSKMINSQLGEKRIRIKMGGGGEQTANAFRDYDGEACLLIDLEGPENESAAAIKRMKLELKKDKVFFMVQAMETWFMSQNKLLDDHFGTAGKLNGIYGGKNIRGINKPSAHLANSVTNSRGKKKEYHKTRDGAEILLKLDSNQLYSEIPEFKALITKIRAGK